MAEVRIYGPIDWFSADRWCGQIEAKKGQPINARINTSGGGPSDAHCVIAKLQEVQGNLHIQVDGKAHSMGAFFPLYAKKVTALDVTDFVFHRAAYPDRYENSPYITEGEIKSRDNVNAKLRQAMEAKIDQDKWLKITGTTLDDLFSTDGRIDVTLTAEQAKEVGIVDEIITITPELEAEINTELDVSFIPQLAAQHHVKASVTPTPAKKPVEVSKSNYNNMTKQELKAQNPALYAEVFAEGKADGVANEKDRIGSLLAWIDVDKTFVEAAIKEDKRLTETDKSTLSLKAQSPDYLKKLEAKAVPETPTDEVNDKTKEQQELEAAKEEVAKYLSVKLK